MPTQTGNDVVAAMRLMLDDEGKYRAEIHVKNLEYVIVIDKGASIEAVFKEAAMRIAGSTKPRSP